MKRICILTFALVCFSAAINAAKYKISSPGDYQTAEHRAQAGDTIVWENGTYADVIWNINKDRLHVMASEPGKTIFTGKSKVEIKGSHISFSGFQYVGGSTDSDVCKITGSHNLLEHLNFSAYHSKYYLNIGLGCQYNTIRYCNFEKKPEGIQSSVVQVNVDEEFPGYHLISRCSFRNHTAPANAGGDYGIEALRIGYSFQAKFISRTVVEYCYFSQCNGDGEVISSKARENVFRYNTFENNGESHFTLRHGSDNVVYGNFFIGGAGLRIKEGQNQMVYNNYFNTGKYWAIKLENYKADQLKNIIIANNTFINSGTLMLGGKGDFKPEQVIVANNLFYKPTATIYDDPTGKETFSENGFIETSADFNSPGFLKSNAIMKVNEQGFFQPEKKISFKNSGPLKILDIPELDDDPGITADIVKNLRKDKLKTIGCYEPGKNSFPTVPYVSASNTGPVYLQEKAILTWNPEVITNTKVDLNFFGKEQNISYF